MSQASTPNFTCETKSPHINLDIFYVMEYNYIMKVKEVINKIKDLGWYQVRQKGSHRQFKNDNIKGLVTIAGKLSDEIDRGTLNSISKQAAIK